MRKMAQKEDSGRGTYKIDYEEVQSDTMRMRRLSGLVAIFTHCTKERRSL